MKPIKEAFVEGRTTDTDWSDSTAKIAQNQLNLYTLNIDNFNGTAFQKSKAMERVDIDTGEVLDYFHTRLDAARWIVCNVLDKKYQKTSASLAKKASSICGNLHMCVASGWKAYGNYWKYVDVVKQTKDTIDNSKSPIYVRAQSGERVYSSIAVASKSIGIPTADIRKAITTNKKIDKLFIMNYNKKPIEKTFKSIAQVSDYFKISHSSARKMQITGEHINNIKIIINNPRDKQFRSKSEIHVFSGNTLVAQCGSIAEAVRLYNTTREKIVKVVDTRTVLNGKRFKRVTVVSEIKHSIHVYSRNKCIGVYSSVNAASKALGEYPNYIREAMAKNVPLHGRRYKRIANSYTSL